jgi:gamma-glutamyltranspeptidase/glutathione hydrolase
MTGSAAFTTRPQLAGTFGMVASTHWLASAAGMAVLERGGNAFDAAVAAGLVLQVVEPHLNGPGGEVPVIGVSAGDGQPFVLDGQGPAPSAATTAHFAGLGLDLIPGTGLLAACVPAAFGTWMLLLERYGTLRLRDVLEYAIGYASQGYPMLPAASAAIAAVAGTFREHWPGSAEVYLADGVPPPGGRFANRALAAVYQRILTEAEQAGPGREQQIEAARQAFYTGFVAEAIVTYLARAEVMDVTGQPHRGLLTGADLAAWQASAEQPVTADFRGLTVCKTGPWGQGPVFLQQLALLDGLGIDELQPGSAELIHLVTEAAKLAFADREAWYGDPRQSPVPLASLLSAQYAATRRTLITDRASAELRPGAPDGLPPRLPGYAQAAFAAGGGVAAPGTGEPTASSAGLSAPELGPGDTCHLDVADRFGDTQRWLAAKLAGDPRTGLLPRHQGADVHADARAGQHAGAGPAAPDDPVARPGPARGRAVPGFRHARRRPAGPVVTGVLPQSRAVRHEPAGSHRCPRLPHRPFPELVLSARISAEVAGH